MEGIQLGTPQEWADPNAEDLRDSPADYEALLGIPFYTADVKKSGSSPIEQ